MVDSAPEGGIRDVPENEFDDQQSGQGSPRDSARPRIRMLGIHALLAVPPAVWLIDGIMLAGTLVGVIGKPGSWKTFLALDWALSIATGQPWNGRALISGSVVYVAAEGAAGIRKRVQAWCQVHALDPEEVLDKRFFVIDHPVQLRDVAEVAAVIEGIRDRLVGVQLVVIDTLARCFVGGEENSAGEMGEIIGAIGSIQSATGAAVLVVHHVGRTGENPRGSSAFDGALDTAVLVEASGQAISVTCRKQKDEAEFDELHFTGVVVDLRGDDAEKLETSCVLVAKEPENSARNSHGEKQSTMRALCRAAWELGENSEIGATSLIQRSGLKTSTAYRGLNALLDDGYFQLVRETKPRSVRLTEKGAEFSRSQFSPIPTEAREKSDRGIPSSHAEPPSKGASAENRKSRASPTEPKSERKKHDPEGVHA